MLHIDTAAANRPYIVHSTTITTSNAQSPVPEHLEANASPEDAPLLSSFVGGNSNGHRRTHSHLIIHNDQMDAPPSYLEATTPSLWTGRHSTGDEAAGLLAYDGRRGMSTPRVEELADPLDGKYKGPNYKKGGFRERCLRRVWKWVAAVLIIVILAGVIAAVIRSGKKETTTSSSPVIDTPAQPAAGVSHGEAANDYPIRWPSRCGKEYKVKTEEIDFGSSSDLRIEETVQQLTGAYKRVAGWIHVVPASEEQAAGTIRAKFSYAVTPSVDINSVKFEASTSSLTIGDPSVSGLLNSIHRSSECLGMSVVLYVAQGAEIENLKIRATHMGMQVHEGVDFTVTNTTSISLTTGTLDTASLNSRETRLETVSGSISGKYTLKDLLYVNTVSGSVTIDVEPKEGLTEGTAAVFQAQSLSGSIRADFERTRIPERDYQTSIGTKVGSIGGTFIHGSRTSLQSVAGSISADLLPFKAGDYPSTIETDSRSGETHVEIQSPYRASESLSKLTSTHKTISGAINLIYPQAWEGHLDGNTLSGALHLQGKDLQLIDQVTEPGKNHVEARKGKGNSELTFASISGGCDVRVGRL